ncbi:ParA family protein [Polaribacter glomeratus]|uniref:Conjugal transfer protein TraA n=1 Tax=Polaribacter glomeratus TaxID=102 RepID=A0A2S7WYL9_9FLAO|nr:ParA family protein [Polaribacter glomeratus]PQJ82616.1 conjugal transfer protein TraA [Polaribacter glomeratus]TXD64928.1 ParA family protein [Polaribacter glomeratus]
MKNNPKIIVITNQKGGVGKSTLCALLAINLSSDSKVAILDFDPQGSLSQLKDIITAVDIIPYKRGVEEILELEYDFIFIDTPPYLSNHLPKLIELADLIVVPLKGSALDLLALSGTLDLIEQKNKKSNTLIVFNMIKANTTLTLDILIGLEEYNVPIAKTHISDLVAFTRSVLVGGVKNDKNAQKQIDNLTREILIKLI